MQQREQSKPFFSVRQKGLSKQIVSEISDRKNEPGWMTDFRLFSLEMFYKLKVPTWGPDISALDFDDLFYYVQPVNEKKRTWEDVPENIKKTFDRIGVPQAEKEMLAGLGAQFDSEIIYKNIKKQYSDKGVIFCSMDDGVRLHPQIVKKYFASVVSQSEHKLAALNSAVWSGGSFVYVPCGVEIDQPLQTYFRIEAEQFGQFERTLIIAEKGSKFHYVEGCSAPVYRAHSLHSAVVEIVAMENSSIKYSTIQNWTSNVYNLVTKRAFVYKNATMQWVDGNFGSKVTMKYPCMVLKEQGARGEVVSISVAKEGQHQDSGAKIIHLGADTSSHVISKSICKDGGRVSYRGLVSVAKGATGARSKVQCDSLILDECSRSDTYPKIDVKEQKACVEHEAFVSKINEEKLEYLMLNGINEQAARSLVVNGFLEPFICELPDEYAVEISRLIDLEMEGSVG
ncbi:Fe-S cluster assembly protein SufB [bacterium]|jgi:Fe-S cluster assembly protein SufB|nr:Fe-S cluster assembly protein SufB [bacterium]